MQCVFVNFTAKRCILKTQRNKYFCVLVYLVKYTTKQPLEPDKEITILLVVSCSNSVKMLRVIFTWERKLYDPCSLCYNNSIWLFCFVVFGQDMTQTLRLPEQDQKNYCLAEEECIRVIFLAVYQALLKVGLHARSKLSNWCYSLNFMTALSSIIEFRIVLHSALCRIQDSTSALYMCSSSTSPSSASWLCI